MGADHTSRLCCSLGCDLDGDSVAAAFSSLIGRVAARRRQVGPRCMHSTSHFVTKQRRAEYRPCRLRSKARWQGISFLIEYSIYQCPCPTPVRFWRQSIGPSLTQIGTTGRTENLGICNEQDGRVAHRQRNDTSLAVRSRGISVCRDCTLHR